MSTINEHNLDELLFDYLEGNLSEAEAAELEAFLEAHPEHAAELAAWEATYVKPGANIPVYAGAQSLVQSGAGAWYGGLNLLGWGTLVVAVAGIAVLLAVLGGGEEELTKEKAAIEADRMTVVEPEPLVTVADTVAEDKMPLAVAVLDSTPAVTQIGSVYQPEIAKKVVGQPTEEDLHQKRLQSANYHSSGLERSSWDSLTVIALPDGLPLPTDSIPAVVDTTIPADTSQVLAAKPQDFSTQRSTPPGKKAKKKRKKNRPKKPVRVVPLKSDAF